MGSTTKKFYVLTNCILLWGLLNTEYLAETKNSIINLFCIQNFKEEMLKANIDYDVEIAIDTCDCYLREFSKSTSHQKAIDKCKLETKKKFNL
tara:strand:- start:133 stop:411 length:279 start_codon:yes stop_codon:yes gene_type:complete